MARLPDNQSLGWAVETQPISHGMVLRCTFAAGLSAQDRCRDAPPKADLMAGTGGCLVRFRIQVRGRNRTDSPKRRGEDRTFAIILLVIP